MAEHDIINKRINEVRSERDVLLAKLSKCDEELAELDTAKKVIARLTGVSEETDPTDGKAKRYGFKDALEGKGKPSGLPTMPELIIMALKHANRPLKPKEITEVIRHNWWPEVDGRNIGSIVWRLNSRNDIEKVDGTSSYRLPQKEEAPDGNAGEQSSEASLFNPDPEAQGQKARPGGGT